MNIVFILITQRENCIDKNICILFKVRCHLCKNRQAIILLLLLSYHVHIGNINIEFFKNCLRQEQSEYNINLHSTGHEEKKTSIDSFTH